MLRLYNNDQALLLRSPFSTMSLVVYVPLTFIAFWLLRRVTEKKPLGRPIPGPKGWPIIGNILDIPTELEYQVFSQWQRKYGKSRMVVLIVLERNKLQFL